MLRGALLLSLNLKEMKRYIVQEEQKFLVLFGLIAIGTIFATVIAVNRLFLGPLKTIQKGAEAIEKRDFKYQIPVKSKDELGALAENFNRMAQTLQDSFKEISRSQKEWEETFDRINDPIVVVDNDCNILKANHAFQETFGKFFSLQRGEDINKCFSELFGTCLLSDCPRKMSMQDRTPVTREIHDQKTGKIFEISVFPYYSPEEVFKGSVAIMKDVTGKKENEMRLMMSERLAALGEMASGIAHEINNPLATIAACTEALLNRMEKEKIGSILFENYLRIIQDEINRCKNITDGMLSFVKKRDDGKQDVEVNEALDKTLEMINFQGRLKDVDVLRHYQEEVPVIYNNEGDLRQAFLSIITNAVDAMEGKGTLIIETGTAGNCISIKISDSGPGIPPHLINRIFDPFFTTKSAKGGTGLGLSIADKIIKENNGKIDVVSEEGKGTTFTITLPI
jgi:PAS domain S-box-containing protein